MKNFEKVFTVNLYINEFIEMERILNSILYRVMYGFSVDNYFELRKEGEFYFDVTNFIEGSYEF